MQGNDNRSDTGKGTKFLNIFYHVTLFYTSARKGYKLVPGEISLLNAWQSGATIDKKTDQDKVRRNLKKIGYKAQFSRGILTIVKTTPGYLTLCNS